MRREIQADSHDFALYLVGDFLRNSNLQYVSFYYSLTAQLIGNRPPAVESLFKIRMLSERICSDCRHVHTSDPSDDVGLQLSLTDHTTSVHHTTIDECVRGHFATQTIRDARCDNCRKTVSTKTFAFDTAPEVLIVQLKRFVYNRRNRMSKDESPISYGEYLDLTPYAKDESLNQQQGVIQYKLHGVVAHDGELNAGHYIAYARGPHGWAGFDDDRRVWDCTLGEALDPKDDFTPYI